MEGNEDAEELINEEEIDDPEQVVHLLARVVQEESEGDEVREQDVSTAELLYLSPSEVDPLGLDGGSQWSFVTIADQEVGDGGLGEEENGGEMSMEDAAPVEEGKVIILNDRLFAYIQNQDSCQIVPFDDTCSTLITVAEPEGSGGDLKIRKKARTHYCMIPGCTKAYTSVHHLKVHVRNHIGERPYSCATDGCKKSFTTVYSLKAHLRTHTGEKPYSCPIQTCTKSFKTSGDLQKHVRTHTGERPFICPVEGCNRSFTTSNIRKVHIRTHTGERPYVCDSPGCDRSFASLTNYKNHVRIHSGEKPYTCSVPNCGKRFTEYSSLYKHQWVHSQERRHPCDLCGKTYRQSSTLSSHRRTVHGVISTQDGSQLILERVIGLGADGSTNFKNITSNLLNLKRDSSALIAIKEDNENSFFIVSQTDDDDDGTEFIDNKLNSG